MNALVRLLPSILALSWSAAFAAKPAPPPPPPSGCAGAGGDFPSIVYQVPVVTGGGVMKTRDIYIGNSSGTCAVKVYSIPGTARPVPHNLSMSFDGSLGRIVWDQGEQFGKNQPTHAVIKMVEFHVVEQQITDALPLAASNVYVDPLDSNNANIADVNISTAGDSIVFARAAEQRELRLVDISTCWSACSASPLPADGPYTWVTGSVFAPGGNNRVYFTAQKTGEPFGLFFIEKSQDGTWTPPRLVASMGDTFYWDSSRILSSPSAADIVPSRKVVSFSWFSQTNRVGGVDVLDVTDCSVEGSGSCLEGGGAIVVNNDIPVSVGDGSNGWRNDGALLISVEAVGLNHMHAVDPVSLELVVDHGPGGYPDGVK